jgi:hypothetical protein
VLLSVKRSVNLPTDLRRLILSNDTKIGGKVKKICTSLLLLADSKCFAHCPSRCYNAVAESSFLESYGRVMIRYGFGGVVSTGDMLNKGNNL